MNEHGKVVMTGYDPGEKTEWMLTECRVNFCYKCPGFSCEHLKTIDKRQQELQWLSFANITFIKDQGITAFLKKRKRNGSALTVAGHSAATRWYLF